MHKRGSHYAQARLASRGFRQANAASPLLNAASPLFAGLVRWAMRGNLRVPVGVFYWKMREMEGILYGPA